MAGAPRAAALACHVDRAARAAVRVGARRGTRAPAGAARSGGVRVESPEPHGRAGDPLGAARPLARAGGAGDAEGVLHGALPSRRTQLAAVVHQLAELLPRVLLLQYVS